MRERQGCRSTKHRSETGDVGERPIVGCALSARTPGASANSCEVNRPITLGDGQSRSGMLSLKFEHPTN
jgi:hypothetical protein